MKESNLTRRDFLGSVAAGTVAAAYLTANPRMPLRPGPDQAPDGPVIKAGLIGCGGRGTGAALNFIDAGPNLRVTALADVFADQIEKARMAISKARGQEIAPSHCFVGFDAYQKLIESDVDVILHATPPHFRPEHFAAAVAAKKHVFIEKPVAVDPVGLRSVLETAQKADQLGVRVMTGTQMRRDPARIETVNRVADGAIGDILAIRCFRNQGALWYRTRKPEWSDMEYMIRDWVNWNWLSGDHIVEQHIHELDQIYWYVGAHPVKASGMGGRARRKTGDQFDYFSIDYEFESGVHMHGTTRQVNGCANVREQILIGTKGICNCDGVLYDLKGKLVWQHEGVGRRVQEERDRKGPQVQEHVDWVTAIRTGNQINAAYDTAISTMIAIMGRETCYTGKLVTWDELMKSNMRLGPKEYALGPVALEAKPPIPGEPAGPPRAA